MWRVFIAFFSHRILLAIALTVAISQTATDRSGWFGSAPVSVVKGELLSRVGTIPEAVSLREWVGEPVGKIFKRTRNPLLWLGHTVRSVTHLDAPTTLIILSTIFFLFFLSELQALIARMVTNDIAVATPILAVYWPTSYELNLGSTMVMSCFLLTFAVRKALDDRWLQCGIGLALLWLIDPIAVGLVPLCGYFFWYFQRHYFATQVAKRAAFFLLPVVAAAIWGWQTDGNVFPDVSQSALLNLFSSVQSQTLKWTLAQSSVGQTIAALFFGVGAVVAALSNQVLIHRILPGYLFALVLGTSPYGSIASRALLAGACLQGVASACSRTVLYLIQVILVALSVFEVFFVFK